MERSVVLAGGGLDIAELVALAVDAERAGFDAIHTVEAWRSGLVPLTAIACATSTIGLGTYVLNAHLRTPLLAGMSARDLDELSGGRVRLTVGTGNPHMNTVWHGLDTSRPADTMEEYVALLRQILSMPEGTSLVHEGRFFRCSWSPPTPAQRPRMDVGLAAMYPRMQAVAGRVANGVALAAFCGVDYIAEVVRPRVAKAATAAGRDPDEVRVAAAALTFVGEDSAARDAMRHTVARLLGPPPHPYYDHVLEEQGEGPTARAISSLMAEGRTEAAAELVTDEFLDRFTVAGSPRRCTQILDRYSEVLDEVVLTNAAGVDAVLGHGASTLADTYRRLFALGPGAQTEEVR